ncbi:MAG TPA: BlaI/MecI/CopY family transcriptional regulator [Candidatus Faecalicoccus intestinipullorum]|nr:BlaI/MecI/CopY family transcriptional regulator [Candidatus Faecalicoccus intestinipullorum]
MTLKLLTKKENEVMSILWQSKKPMTAHQIVETNNSLSIYTVQQVLQRLLKMDYVRIAEINYSGTVFARFYEPSISQTNYIQFLLGVDSPYDIASHLIDSTHDDKELEKLEQLIKKKRDSLKR